MKTEVIWAKSPKDRNNPAEGETLEGHTRGVCESAKQIVDILSASIREICGCFDDDLENWRVACMAGAWIHDWGKANDHFQKMLFNFFFKQGIRHEALSAFIAHRLVDWLKPLWNAYPDWVKAAVFFSIAGHHIKFPDKLDRPGTEITLLLGHGDFSAVLSLGKNMFPCLGDLPSLNNETHSLLSRKSINKTLGAMEDELRKIFDELGDKEKRLLALVKPTVIAADLAGSALIAKGMDYKSWIREKLDKSLTKGDLLAVAKGKLNGKQPRPFQETIQSSKAPTIILEAGCGSGKTVAAYLWAAEKANGKRLFFCYPTTGTASEGFANYLHEPDFDAILVQSRAKADYKLLSNMPPHNDETLAIHQFGLEALDTWPMPVVVCTAHTVLGLLENFRRGIYAWPSLAMSVFVFDEIHSFDPTLFSYLLRFLKEFDKAPVLLMSASIDRSRKEALLEVCRNRGEVEIIDGPKEREEAKRYRIIQGDAASAWEKALVVYSGGGKVLWICNTVSRASKYFRQAQNQGIRAIPYHSRYKYKDRLKLHRKTIDGFATTGNPIFAVTTQVAEMSLDISADLLISEFAPVPALIQRLGRLNRSHDIPAAIDDAYLYRPENMKPYDEEQLHGMDDWTTAMADEKPKSQKDLAVAFANIQQTGQEEISPIQCNFFDAGWETVCSRSIQQAGFTMEVVMEEDRNADPVECAIPMPIPKKDIGWENWERMGRFFIAPSGTIEYDELGGARWKKN